MIPDHIKTYSSHAALEASHETSVKTKLMSNNTLYYNRLKVIIDLNTSILYIITILTLSS